MDHKKRKLGKRKAIFDVRTLKLEKYVDLTKLPAIPAEMDWGKKVSGWRMLKNDEIGDCAIVGKANLIQDWTSNESSEVLITEQDVVDNYTKLSGYDPQTGENDHGCYLIEVLQDWKAAGIKGSHVIDAYALVNAKNTDLVKAGIYIFGGLYTGFALPLSIQNKDEWEMPSYGPEGDGTPGSWGGHCVMIVAYDYTHVYAVSWGQIIKISWAFFHQYCDESYVILTKDWISDTKAPNGLDLEQLNKDLKLITS